VRVATLVVGSHGLIALSGGTRTVGCMTANATSLAVEFFRQNLGLTRPNWDIVIDRVSVNDLKKLADQEQTALTVFGHLDDVAKLRAEGGTFESRGWIPFRQSDIHARGSQARCGWVGVVGNTIFLAVAGSAAAEDLPADDDDPAALGRNAFMTALVALAIAGGAANVYVPFLSRIWRDNHLASYLVRAIGKRLPHCAVWDGQERLALDGSGHLVTLMKGAQQTTYVSTLKEQTFNGAVNKVLDGQWPRAEIFLPAGLRRVRGTEGDVTKLSPEVEIHEPTWTAVVAALKMMAAGRSYQEIGEQLVEVDFPKRGMRGAKTGLRRETFASYSTVGERTDATRRMLTKPESLSYWRTGRFGFRQGTNAPLGADGRIRGHEVVRDEQEAEWVWQGEISLVHRRMLTDAEWASIDERLSREEVGRQHRLTGAAARSKSGTKGAAFQGVVSWDAGSERQGKLAPETPTAYRWRERPTIQRTGWANGEGDHCATLRRQYFDRACGQAILAAINDLDTPIASVELFGDPAAAHRRRVEELSAERERIERVARRAAEELLQAEDADDQELWRSKHAALRQRHRALDAELDTARNMLEQDLAEQRTEDTTEDVDVTMPALVASLLLESDNEVERAVTDGLHRLGITSSLRLAFTDPNTLPAHQLDRRNPDRSGRIVVATATMQVELADGTTAEIPLRWLVPDSFQRPGTTVATPLVIRQWAEGSTWEEISNLVPDVPTQRVRERVMHTLRAHGIGGRYLSTIAAECPIVATRQVIAARVLSDRSIIETLEPGFVKHIEQAYWSSEPWQGRQWCDKPRIAETRRVLAVFDAASPAAWSAGLDTDAVARHAQVARSVVREIGRKYAAFEMPTPTTIRPFLCDHCGQPMTVYNPAPETGDGVICRGCSRARSYPAVLGGEYVNCWQRIDGGYRHGSHPSVSRPDLARDRHLGIREAAERLGVPTHIIRHWDKSNLLVPVRHTRHGDRLYRPDQLDDPEIRARAAQWQKRHALSVNPSDGLLTTGDAAALLDTTPKVIRTRANQGLLEVAARTPGGHRLFTREAVIALGELGFTRDLEQIASVAESAGIATNTLRDLANQGLVPCVTVPDTNTRWFDRVIVHQVLDELDLLASPDNPLVSIGTIAARSGRGQAELRTLADSGQIPTAGRLGGKRRFRLTDTMAALDQLPRQ
jgi:DNA-binding transcriptional MerR regulator